MSISRYVINWYFSAPYQLSSCVSDTFLSSCAGERLGMVEAQCERVRMLYRDCARPPPPPLQTDRRQVGATKYIDKTPPLL